MLKVKISIENTKGKKAELELNETDDLSKLVIIQNVFNLFGIENDILGIVDDYNKIGKAYNSFFNQIEPIEKSQDEIQKDNKEIKDQLIKGLIENKEELESTYKETNDLPLFVKTGIKIDKDGTKRYRCHYICSLCDNRGSHYIYQHSSNTWCHACRVDMATYDAHPNGFPNRDSFGNFYRAGEFQDRSLDW